MGFFGKKISGREVRLARLFISDGTSVVNIYWSDGSETSYMKSESRIPGYFESWYKMPEPQQEVGPWMGTMLNKIQEYCEKFGNDYPKAHDNGEYEINRNG